MKVSFKHIFLLIGIATTILSFFWFGRKTGIYDTLLLVGLVISTVSFLIILFTRGTVKNKLFWTVIVIGSIPLIQLTEPLLIRLSYKYFVTQHEDNLKTVTELIKSKQNNFLLSLDSELWMKNGFTPSEAYVIKDKLKDTGIDLIQKDSARIYYRTWGRLDISHGIFYFYNNNKPDYRYKKIYGNWYY